MTKKGRGIWKTDEMNINDSDTKKLSSLITKASPQTQKGQREDSVPDEESEDFRAKDQPSGVMDAQ